MKRHLWLLGICCLLIGMISGCAAPEKEVSPFPLMRISPSEYPEFADDMAYEGLARGISKSLDYLDRVSGNRTFEFGGDIFDTAHMARSLTHFLNFIRTNPSPRQLREFIASDYLVYRSVGNEETGQVLFTGYYEPLLHGSLDKSRRYRFPVYTRPRDLMTIDLSLFSPEFEGKKITGRLEGRTFIPYYDRSEIDQKQVLKDKADVIAWVDDLVDLFFLQIQGSGKIALDNGQKMNVHYHSQNGRPYRSIGSLLIREGKVSREEMSMQKIREYLSLHPGEVKSILNYNPSYVFFQTEEGGPYGAINVALTPGRSLAVDRRIFPMAALSFVETQKPRVDVSGTILDWTDCTRFVLNQDTGGAIKGPGRADLFWGHGEYAEVAAGHLKHRGNLYLLVLKK